MEEVEKGNGKKVCVTGASGYIGSWLVKLLLQRGYIVNATIRDPKLEGAKERLHLFKANLMEEGSLMHLLLGVKAFFTRLLQLCSAPKIP
ncbi:Tetraketide alpha-pyrone reductase 1, partial [Bienertia sinuspersici]